MKGVVIEGKALQSHSLIHFSKGPTTTRRAVNSLSAAVAEVEGIAKMEMARWRKFYTGYLPT